MLLGDRRSLWVYFFLSCMHDIYSLLLIYYLPIVYYYCLFLIHLQENLAVDSEFALDQVPFSPKEQNLPMLFNEGENSQVMTFHSECAAVYQDRY